MNVRNQNFRCSQNGVELTEKKSRLENGEFLSWEDIPNCPNVGLPPQLLRKLEWHRDATSPISSQAYCISAFGCIEKSSDATRIVEALSQLAFPSREAVVESPSVFLEFEYRKALGELSGHATAIDAFIQSRKLRFVVESKFLADANDGFGRCKKAAIGECKGFYGPGSNKINDQSWCLHERLDGRFSPRLYWTIGKMYFRPEVFVPQSAGDVCPFRRANYQLMRNFLFAAHGLSYRDEHNFGLIVICPRRRRQLLVSQIADFKRDILLPVYHPFVSLIYYEDYLKILVNSADENIQKIGGFLLDRLESEVGLEHGQDQLF